jgi:hypothetical protein
MNADKAPVSGWGSGRMRLTQETERGADLTDGEGAAYTEREPKG